MAEPTTDLYSAIIEQLFHSRYVAGAEEVAFQRHELETVAQQLGVPLPKNLGDVVYAFKYRRALPESIRTMAPPQKEWVIVNRGRSQYAFETRPAARIRPDPLLITVKVPMPRQAW